MMSVFLRAVCNNNIYTQRQRQRQRKLKAIQESWNKIFMWIWFLSALNVFALKCSVCDVVSCFFFFYSRGLLLLLYLFVFVAELAWWYGLLPFLLPVCICRLYLTVISMIILPILSAQLLQSPSIHSWSLCVCGVSLHFPFRPPFHLRHLAS